MIFCITEPESSDGTLNAILMLLSPPKKSAMEQLANMAAAAPPKVIIALGASRKYLMPGKPSAPSPIDMIINAKPATIPISVAISNTPTYLVSIINLCKRFY